jgi:hypothetical protein
MAKDIVMSAEVEAHGPLKGWIQPLCTPAQRTNNITCG